MSGWSDFAVAAAGATAALAGLVIVAVSVNVREILRAPNLVSRAGGTIAALISALLVALASLVPQPPLALGKEILAVGAVAAGLETRAAVEDVRVRDHLGTRKVVGSVTLSVLWLVPLIASGVLACASSGAAPYLLAAAVALAVVAAIVNTWVLLIEILR